MLVHVRAAALKPVDRQIARGSHYAGPRALPVVCGTDGVGVLEDGTRVFFGGPRAPFGAMAQRTTVSRHRCFPLPHDVDDVTAAALVNPGLSAWLALTSRARIVAGERVLVLGATGITGRLVVQIARLLGASRVVAAGRNERVLGTLHELGADATICIGDCPDELQASFLREAGDAGFDLILDLLWGRPTEVLLESMTQREFRAVNAETRLLQVGESAGPTIALAAAALRSRALTILGTAGIPPPDVLTAAFQQVMERAARGELRVGVEPVPLADVESAWKQNGGDRRLVLIP